MKNNNKYKLVLNVYKWMIKIATGTIYFMISIRNFCDKKVQNVIKNIRADFENTMKHKTQYFNVKNRAIRIML